MSKIAISGASTGTATFTIESPATSTNRTLTLPDNTGTIITQNSTPAFASTIGVGGATAAASGAGITFPATQSASSDANTLDDYEEGTWTPTISRTGSSYTYGDNANGYRTGKYVKIGNTVYCWFSITIASIATQGSSFNVLSGLPFASGGGAFARYGGSVSVCTVLTTATSMYLGGSSETQALFSNQSNPLQTTFVTGEVFGFLSYQIT